MMKNAQIKALLTIKIYKYDDKLNQRRHIELFEIIER